MKHSLFRKTVSLMLCVVLLGLCALPAFAETKTAKYPVLFVEGFNGSPLYKDGTEKVFMPTESQISTLATSLITTLLTFAAQKDIAVVQGNIDAQAKAYDGYIDSIINMGASVFGKFACDEHGNSIDPGIDVLDIDKFGSAKVIEQTNVKEHVIPAASAALGEDMVYYFTYDWRNSLIDTAALLNDAIKAVKKETGKDKVSLFGMSMGGALLNTYATIYGTDDICNLTFSSAAFQGLQYIGEIFTGKMEIDGDELGGLIDDFLRKDVKLRDLLKYSNVYKRLLDDLNEAIRYDKEGVSALGGDEGSTGNDRIKNDLLIPYFAYLPGMWTFVPDAYYEEAINYIFGADARFGESADLVAKLDAYHFIQTNMKANLTSAMNKGVTVSIVSHYNTHIAPVTPTAKTLTGDSTIETLGTSAGAITAPIGSTFEDGYKQALHPEKNYISPDNIVDASTCMFPEITWFVKNLRHMEFDKPDEGNNTEFFIWLATAEEQYTVESDELYPQFLFYDSALKRLSCFFDLGDVTYDGDISLADARRAYRLAKGLDETNANLEAPADYDRDGAVSQADGDAIFDVAADSFASAYAG